MFTPSKWVETTVDSMPHRRYEKPFKQSLNFIQYDVNHDGVWRRVFGNIPRGSTPGTRSTSTIRVLSMVVRVVLSMDQASSRNPQYNYVKNCVIVYKNAPAQSNNTTLPIPSSTLPLNPLIGAQPGSPKQTCFAFRNHENRGLFSFLYDRVHFINPCPYWKVSNDAQFAPEPKYYELMFPNLDLLVTFQDDYGVDCVGDVPILGFAGYSIYTTNVKVYVNTVFIDVDPE